MVLWICVFVLIIAGALYLVPQFITVLSDCLFDLRVPVEDYEATCAVICRGFPLPAARANGELLGSDLCAVLGGGKKFRPSKGSTPRPVLRVRPIVLSSIGLSSSDARDARAARQRRKSRGRGSDSEESDSADGALVQGGDDGDESKEPVPDIHTSPVDLHLLMERKDEKRGAGESKESEAQEPKGADEDADLDDGDREDAGSDREEHADDGHRPVETTDLFSLERDKSGVLRHSRPRIKRAARGYAPFENATVALLNIWSEKNLIGRSAYDELHSILEHPEFDAEDVPNWNTLKKIRDALPLAQVYKTSVKMKSGFSAAFRFFSIFDLISHFLNNEALRNEWRWDAAISSGPVEYTHGRIHREHPLLNSIVDIKLGEAVYSLGSFVRVANEAKHPWFARVAGFALRNGEVVADLEWLYRCAELAPQPARLRSPFEREHELWFSDEREFVSPSLFVGLVHVYAMTGEGDFEHDRGYTTAAEGKEALYVVREVYSGTAPHFRSAVLKHQSFATKFPCPTPPPGLQLLKVGLILFYDDFPSAKWRKASLGGVYIGFSNLSAKARRKLKNTALFGFVPPDVSFHEAIEPFLAELERLHKGVVMRVFSEERFVVGTVSVTLGDLPGNKVAHVKGPSGKRGCRCCDCTSEELANFSLDLRVRTRYSHLMREERESLLAIAREVQAGQETKTALGDAEKKSGLHAIFTKFDYLIDIPRQIPPDPFHSELGGITSDVNEFMLNQLSVLGQKFLRSYSVCWGRWRAYEWSSLKDPLGQLRQWSFLDHTRMMMMMPFVCRAMFRNKAHWKRGALAELQANLGAVTEAVAIQRFCNLACIVAKTNREAFRQQVDEGWYSRFDALVKEERKAVLKIMPEMRTRPNMHVGMHHRATAENYGTLLNASVHHYEMVHRSHRRRIKASNWKDITHDLMLRENVMVSYRLLLEDHALSGRALRRLFGDSSLSLLWNGTALQHERLDDDAPAPLPDDPTATEPLHQLPATKPVKPLLKLSDTQLHARGESPFLSDDEAREVLRCFKETYAVDWKALDHPKAVYAKRMLARNRAGEIAFRVDEGDHVAMHADEGRGRQVARVERLFSIKDNYDDLAHLIRVRWLADSGRVDEYTQLPILEEKSGIRDMEPWRTVFPVVLIRRVVNVQHLCQFPGDGGRCTLNEKDGRIDHDLTRNQWAENVYMFDRVH